MGALAAGPGRDLLPAWAAKPGVGVALGCVAALFLVAGEINMIGAERIVRGHYEADGRIDAREFFDDDGVIDVAESGAAEFFRKNGA